MQASQMRAGSCQLRANKYGASVKPLVARCMRTTVRASRSTPVIECRKVAVLGAAGGIGQPLSLLLKVRCSSMAAGGGASWGRGVLLLRVGGRLCLAPYSHP